MLGYSQQAATAAAAAVAASAAAGRLVNPSSIEESNPSPSVLGASATDTGGDHSRSIYSSAYCCCCCRKHSVQKPKKVVKNVGIYKAY